ncbi:uncharacterized protein moto [Genypterus blacodes]|uniref:uncharacterized protein moto n=1 Tax=Genypterus blacodes TaxID=154954 RepID=UPI003F765F11
MSFDKQLGNAANSLHLTYQLQASEHNGGLALPLRSIPSGLALPEQGLTSRNWGSVDDTDCEGESDLHHLVSDILDERDSQDGYAERNQLKMEQIWNPKAVTNESQQYFESEAKTQTSATFPPNRTYYNSLNKLQEQPVDKDVEEVSQKINGLSITQPLLFNWLNGNMESYTPTPKKLPPGLPIHNMGNPNLSQTEHSKPDYISANNDRGNGQPMNHFLDLGPCFEQYYTDRSIQSNTKPMSDELQVPHDVAQLAGTFQAQSFLNHRESPNVHRQTRTMHQESIMAQQWKFIRPQMSTPSRPTMPIQTQSAREFGPVHGEGNGVVRKPIYNGDGFHDLPGFSPQITEDFQQPNQPSASLYSSKQKQKKLAKHRGNTSLPTTLSMSQYSQHHRQLNQMQHNLKPVQETCLLPNMSNFLSLPASDFGPQQAHQIQRGAPRVQHYGSALIQRQPQQDREDMGLDGNKSRDGDSDLQVGKNRMYTDDFQGEGISARPFTNSHMSEADKKLTLYQNPYREGLGSLHTSSPEGFMLLVNPLNDPRNHSNNGHSLSHFSSRASLSCGKDVGDASANTPCAGRGESIYHDIASSAKMIPGTKNQKVSEFQLLLSLDECFEQCRHLEEDRIKTDKILTKYFPRKWAPSPTFPNFPKMPPKPTKFEQLVVNQIREQRKVANLLDEMKHLCSLPLRSSFSALIMHEEALCVLQARYNDMVNVSSNQRDRETWMLAVALKNLAVATRWLASALWCALEITLRITLHTPSVEEAVAAVCEESWSDPSDDYNTRLTFQMW